MDTKEQKLALMEAARRSKHKQMMMFSRIPARQHSHIKTVGELERMYYKVIAETKARRARQKQSRKATRMALK